MRSKNLYIIILILSAFVISAAAQGGMSQKPTIPFDYADATYKTNGVIPNAILARRNGQDGMSVFDRTPNPMYNEVRVIATVPAYDQNGEMMFWFPLGELSLTSFTPDKMGTVTRQFAEKFPIYIFPDPRLDGFTPFQGHRHAPVIDLSAQAGYIAPLDPLNIRVMYTVYFTERAFTTKDGWAMMQFMGNKNGWGADDTPILKSVDDINYLADQGYVDVKPVHNGEVHYPIGQFVIAPVFQNPTGGAIYPDAFLMMTLKEGKPLEHEDMFIRNFTCLQKMLIFCPAVDVADF